MPTFAGAQGPATRPAEPISVQQPRPVDALIQQIREAQEPSSAIQAYAEARTVAPTDVAIEAAYVHRMAEFGLPEMANQQAQDLLVRSPEDGVAWAVVGYLAAKRDQMDAAATDVAAAAQLAPDNPFTQRTGAQIVAWADSRPDKAVLSAETRVAVNNIRSKLSNKAEYAQAYQGALSAYQRLSEAPAATTQPATAAPSAPVTIAPSDQTMVEPTYVPGPMSTSYPPPYESYAAPYYSSDVYAAPYWYPSYVYSNYWWWPTCSSFIIVDNDCREAFFRHDHDHDFGGFHGRDRGARIGDPHFFNHLGDASFNHGRSPGNAEFNHGRFPGNQSSAHGGFVMAPVGHGNPVAALPPIGHEPVRSGDVGKWGGGTRIVTWPSGPGTFSPAVPSGRILSGGERSLGGVRFEPRPSMPPMIGSPGGRGAWSSPAPSAGRGGGGEVFSHQAPSRVEGPAMSSGSGGERWSGGGGGREMSGGGRGGGRR